MCVSRRGRISALVLSVCALTLSAKASIKTSASQDATADSPVITPMVISSDDLLGLNNTGPKADVDWILRDDRQIVASNLSVSNDATAALNEAPSPALSHVNTPINAENPTHMNDPVVLVPVPVLNVGWAIILCSILFSIGARVLRMPRRARVRA